MSVQPTPGLVKLAGAAVLAALLCSPAIACRCAAPPPSDEAILKTRALAFVGRVMSEKTLENGWREFEFERLELLKGAVKDKRLRVRTPGSSASCGEEFGVGRTYRVHAHSSRGVFTTILCDYNREIPR